MTRKLHSNGKSAKNHTYTCCRRHHQDPEGELCDTCALELKRDCNYSALSKESWADALRWKIVNTPECTPKYPMYNTGIPEVQLTMEKISHNSASLSLFDGCADKWGLRNHSDKLYKFDEHLYGRFELFYYNNVQTYPSKNYFQHVDDFAREEYILTHFGANKENNIFSRRRYSFPNTILNTLSLDSHITNVGIAMGRLNPMPNPIWLTDDPWDYSLGHEMSTEF
jgi:hypothetical protein